MAEGRRIARKLSVKTITGFGPHEMRELVQDGPKELFSVVGVARGTREGTSDYGDWIALTGQFETVNRITGEVSNAGRCFLPGHVTDLLVPAIGAAGKDAAIEFAIMVGVEKADNNFGYEYTCSTFQAPEESDRLSDLRKLLPAPEAVRTGDEKAATEASKK